MIYLLQNSQQLDPVIDFFDYHQIPTTKIIVWDSEISGPRTPQDQDCVLILDYVMFFHFFAADSLYHDLISFCDQGNRVIVTGQYDFAFSMQRPMRKKQLQRLDSMIPNGSVLLLLETNTSDRFYLQHCSNILTLSYNNWHFRDRPRPADRTIHKTAPSHDYLLTMIRRRSRPHRNVLWRALEKRPGLLDRGIVSARHAGQASNQWIGQTTAQHPWQCGHASMDLYRACWLEIVPETCYKNLYFFTEKTQKPIMTRTPFLVVSTAGYLDWLRGQGFRTFHNLVDESYDRQYRVEDRVRCMVDVLEDIIRNGSRDFYQASQDILDHNFSRLCEMTGAWNWFFDQVMWQALEMVNCKKKIKANCR